MKYSLLTLLVSVLTLSSYSQTEKYYNYRWEICNPEEARFYSIILKTDSGYVKQDYFIHERAMQMSGKYKDADCKIPDGYFFYFHPNKNMSSSGRYINGKKEGLWQSFHSNGVMKDSSVYNAGRVTGTYMSWHPNGYGADSMHFNADGSSVHVSWFENGVLSSAGRYNPLRMQQGKWMYYHNNGQPSAIETYDEGGLLNASYFDEQGNPETKTESKEIEAMFGNSDNDWVKYMNKNSYFPDRFKLTNSDKAVVVVTFAVNEEGKVVDAYVSTPFYPEFDKIALNAVQRSNKWKPAISHNRKVKTWLNQVLTFVQRE